MTQLQITVLADRMVDHVCLVPENEAFPILKKYIRENYALSPQASDDLIDCDTVDNFVWFFEQYMTGFSVEFEIVA